MRKPSLTKGVVDGMATVVAFVSADMEDEEQGRFTKNDFAAVEYLSRLIAWYSVKAKKRKTKDSI